MMIIKFFDNSELKVDDRRADRIKKSITNSADFIEVDGEMYRVSTITSIKKVKDYLSMNLIGGAVYNGLTDMTPSTMLTDEERHHNIEKIRQMKSHFLKRIR